MENAVEITEDILSLVKNEIIPSARRYSKLRNWKRKLSITGDIGEILVCEKQILKIAIKNNQKIWDAIDQENKFVQIKTRQKSRDGKLPKRVPKISKVLKDVKYDYVLLAILDEDYNLEFIYRVDREKLEGELDKLQQGEKKFNRNPTVDFFIKIAGNATYAKNTN